MLPSYAASTGSRSTASRPGRTSATVSVVVLSRLPEPSGAAQMSTQADVTPPVTGIENSGRVALPRRHTPYVVAVAGASLVGAAVDRVDPAGAVPRVGSSA